MRYAMFAAALLSSIVAAPASGWAQKACPSDAAKASRDVWSSGAIRRGQTVTGKHPCGKTLQCTGGEGTSNKRTCSWR